MIRHIFKWEAGRLQTGYKKKLLLTGKYPLPFDIYLLKYETGQSIPPHKDKVERKNHYRANFVLWKGVGGEFICEKCIFRSPKIAIFRPDENYHCVSEVISGSRYVLSFGWLWGDKK